MDPLSRRYARRCPWVAPATRPTRGRFEPLPAASLTHQHEVETTFRTQQRQPQPPPELISQNGLLEATFNVQPTTFNVAGAEVQGYAYQGQFIGPTLRVQPGDTVRVRLRNGLKEPTNLHSHGMFVSPIGISDNVLRVMKAGSTNEFVLDLPDDVEPGTYWYHAHLHGRVEEQVFAGLSGVFIVDGLQDRLPPELQDVPERVMAIKDLQVKDGAIVRSNIDSNAPTTRTVNGQVNPILTAETNRTQLLRRQHRCRHLVPATSQRRAVPCHRRGRQPCCRSLDGR